MSVNSNGKTIKQIADELNTDKQRIYRIIKKNHINEALQKNGVMYYDEAAQTLIQSYFARNQTEETTSEKSLASASIEALLKQSEMFEKELEIKNEQIRELNMRLSETTAALVAAQESAKAAQALHAGTIQKQLKDGELSDKAVKKKGFFGFFRK